MAEQHHGWMRENSEKSAIDRDSYMVGGPTDAGRTNMEEEREGGRSLACACHARRRSTRRAHATGWTYLDGREHVEGERQMDRWGKKGEGQTRNKVEGGKSRRRRRDTRGE